MKSDQVKAKELLESGGYTCVFCKGETVLTSIQRGVKPLLDKISAKESLAGFAAADKVVGKAPAMLYAILKPASVYAPVMTLAAVQILRENGIEAFYGQLTDGIRNREGTGSCPMEASVCAMESPEQALAAIRQTAAKLAAKATP